MGLFLFYIATTKDLAERKLHKSRRKPPEAPTAYMQYVEGVRGAATQKAKSRLKACFLRLCNFIP